MCLEQQVLMVPHQQGEGWLWLWILSQPVMQLVRLTLLKGTCCSNLADSFCRKIGLGFLKIIVQLQFSCSLLKLTVLSQWHYRSSLQPLTYTTSWPGKSNLRGIYYSCPLSVESRCKGSIHNPRGTFHLANLPCSHSIIDNPFVSDLVSETTQIHLGRFGPTKAENIYVYVHMHTVGDHIW